MIYTLELKIWHCKVLHTFVWEAMHLQCLPIKKCVGTWDTLTTLYRTLCTWHGYFDACLHCVALLCDYMVVSGQFFHGHAECVGTRDLTLGNFD